MVNRGVEGRELELDSDGDEAEDGTPGGMARWTIICAGTRDETEKEEDTLLLPPVWPGDAEK